MIFRREMAAPPISMGEWWKRTAGSVISGLVILAFVGALAAWLSENTQTGVYFALAIAGGLASLAIVAWLLLRGLRWVSRHLPRRAGPVIRQGIANLYRPGNHAGAAVMALGVGVMFTVTVWIVQRGLLQDIVRTAPPGMPNVYLLDVTAANRDAVEKLLSTPRAYWRNRKWSVRFRPRSNPSMGWSLTAKLSWHCPALFARRYRFARRV